MAEIELTRPVTLKLLGKFEATCDDVVQDLRPSAQRLVAVLATLGPQRRSDLAGRLWPDLSTPRAAGNLRTVLWRIRCAAGQIVVERADGCTLEPAAVDLHSVRSWALSAINGGDPAMPHSVGQELLPGWSDTWLIEPREELRLLQLHGLETTAQQLMAGNRLAEAFTCAHMAMRMDPLRETANRLLIEASMRQGNHVEAVRHFRRFEKLLQDEIGVSVSRTITQLVAPLLPGDALRRR